MKLLLDYLLAERGRMARVAHEAGISPAYLSQIANGVRPVPLEHAAALEKACEGNVRRWQMLPTSWARIWPELVKAEGAPPAEADPAARPEDVERRQAERRQAPETNEEARDAA